MTTIKMKAATKPVHAGAKKAAGKDNDAGQGASAAEKRAQAELDDWRKGLAADEEFVKDIDRAAAESSLCRPDGKGGFVDLGPAPRKVRVELCPDLLTRYELALSRVEEDACWASARNHPKFSRIYTIAEFATLALVYAARALEMTNAGARNEKGRRKFDRALRDVEKIAQALEASTELNALHVARDKGLGESKRVRTKNKEALSEMVAELDREHPLWSNLEMAAGLKAKGVDRSPRRVGQLRNEQKAALRKFGR